MSVWGSLVFSATNTAYQVGSGGLNWRIVKDTSDLEYKNQRYKSVLVHIAKQLLMSELEGQIKKIVFRYLCRIAFRYSGIEKRYKRKACRYERIVLVY